MSRTYKPSARAEPPPDDTNERVVVGTFVAEPDAVTAEIGTRLDLGLFGSFFCQTVLKAALGLRNEGAPLSAITLTQALRNQRQLDAVGGPSEISRLNESATSPLLVKWHLNKVREQAAVRERAKLTHWLANLDESTPTANVLAGIDAVRTRIAEIVEPPKQCGGLPEIENLDDLIDEDVPEPPELVEGILHQGAKMVVGGGSKSFKTWLLTDLGLSVAAGKEWMGFTTSQGRVLYINLEIQRPFFRKRAMAIRAEKTIARTVDLFEVWNLRGHATDLSELLPRLLDGIGERRYALIVIDPIYKVLGDREENAAGDITALLNELERLAVVTGAAVVFGAHFSKGNQASKDPMDRISGSGAYARDPDTLLTLTRHEEEGAFAVECTLRNHAPIESFVVRWEYPLMRRDGALDPAKLKKAAGGAPPKHTAEDLLKILGTRELSMVEWEARAADPDNGKVSESTFYRLTKKLKKEGRIKQSKLTRKWHSA